MCGLIDEYLAFTVAHKGALTLAPVPLRPLVEDIAALYGGTDRAVRLVIDTPHVVRADAALVRQLFRNLIGNAVKYSRPGEGTSVLVRSLPATAGGVRVEVADHGRGLQPGDEERIFEAFARSAKDADAAPGIGLGLSLCATIVARHGGAIGAAANDWGGATFHFTLPLTDATREGPS